YAHAQGVLHRDIKPSNLLLDAQGSIWITDFGLAKAEGSDDLTESGEMVGTLRYMPPERLRGWSDPRSDIYSLGLTLYELLTLEPAFDEVDRGLLMRKIAEEEPAAPRKIEPHLPRDLNTVLTKAMAKEPGQRYQAAGEFAADLRRFLAGEPIQARASSVLERGIKWARRRPTSAALIVVILLAVVIVLSGSLWYNSRLQAQVESTDEAKQDAEESFRKARDAVDRLAEIAQERLSGVPLLENVRKVLLEEVLEFHEKFLEERGEDPAVRLDAARAYLQAGDIYRWLGQAEKSRAALEAGLRLAEDVLIPFPQDAEPMLVLGNLYASLGTVSKNSGRNEESMEFFVDACEVFEEACRRFPERSDFRRRHVDCLGSLGILVKVENPEAAEEICRKEIELAREHAAVAPDLPARLALPMSQLHFSRLLAERGKRREALEIAASAHASLDQFSEQDRMTPQWKALMANVFDLLAMLYRSAGNGEQAEKAQNRSVALLDDLQKDFPLSSIYRSDLASHLSNLGALLQEGGKVSEAKAAYDRAADLFQKLLEEQPGVPQYRVRLARLYGNHSRLLQKDADGPETRWEEAGDYLEKALDLQRSLVEDFPEEPLYVDGLGGLLSSLGVLFMKTKRFEDSRKAFSEGIHLQTQLAEKLPERKETQLLLARLLYNFSNLLASEDDFREARAQLLLAFGALQSARRHDPGDPEARNGLLMMFTSILKIGIVLKEHSKALEFAREAAGEFGDDASLHFDFAGALAQAIALILEDESLTEEFRAQAVDEYAREAVHFLKASSDLGFQSPERARQDPRLEPLRGREDFQAWLATIETR
ncbi:MAG: serine/threonine protein kinase, partial [Planctomycetes bacterium]|nr:serine/threonine protein kinase [Planctomycetota bacterium]